MDKLRTKKINSEKNIDNKQLGVKSADKIVTKTSFSSRVFKEIPIFTQQQKTQQRNNIL